jgi:hypothetical protein
MSEFSLFLIAQSVIIIGAIVTAYIRTFSAIAVLQSGQNDLKEDHTRLTNKVDGISRTVGQIEGRCFRDTNSR